MADIIIPKGTQRITVADGDSVRLVEGDGIVFIVRASACRVDEVVVLNPKTTVTTAEPQENPQRPLPAM